MASEQLDPAVQARIQAKVEKSIPDAKQRKAALELLAYAIENADSERSDAWTLEESGHGLKLFAGRLLVCHVTRKNLKLSVLGPLASETYATLDADADDSEVWKAIPEGLFLTLPIDKAAAALDLLKVEIDKFVDEAMARVRRKVGLEDHSREGIAYVGSVVGRELPHPSEAPEDALGDEDDVENEVDTRDPKPRGRTPIFEHAQRSIAALIDDVKQKQIALPNLQRPFVWEDIKVRDLLDSLFVGYPVGTMVLWRTSNDKEARAIGQAPESVKANTLIIDGQQRLTSLYAVLTGEDVIDKDGTKRKITIAFRPRDGKFEVADAANRNDPEFIPNVTELWAGTKTPSQIRKELIKALEEKGREIDAKYEDAVDHNLARAKAIAEYRFPIVDIRKTDAEEASDQDVAEIFVRINNQGTRLGQADFVLTLLAVFQGNLRDRIEDRAIEMSKAGIITLDTQQLLRATCAVGFARARMLAIYRLLRGADPTGEATNVKRQERLATLSDAADECLDPSMWCDYMLRVTHAGFVSPGLVASNNAIVNAYAFYVLGKRAGVSKPKLDELISRWLFAAQLTSRYSGSSETVFEQDLARLREAKSADAFVQAVDGALAEVITGDYWSHTVVAALHTQRGRSPTALAFRAAQIVLGARALFSDQTMRNLLDPPAKGKRSAGEVHHLFPKAWLSIKGVKETRRINQVANLADVGWWENSTIGSKGPSSYVPLFRTQLHIDDDHWGRACAEHALPLGWETTEYEAFLAERRQRMADIIRVAYRKLGGEADSAPLAPPWFLPGAELVWKRIVETERSLRAVIRDIYAKKFGANAAQRIEDSIPAADRPALTKALRKRPSGADPLSVIDYLYLGQLPALIFSNDAWPEAQKRLKVGHDGKQQLETAVQQIASVRNEIAHVREVSTAQLQKTGVACNDLLEMIGK